MHGLNPMHAMLPKGGLFTTAGLKLSWASLCFRASLTTTGQALEISQGISSRAE